MERADGSIRLNDVGAVGAVGVGAVGNGGRKEKSSLKRSVDELVAGVAV